MTTDHEERSQTDPKPIRYSSRQEAFFKSEAAQIAKSELKLMADNPAYNTRGTFSANYRNHSIPFVERHMKYLSEHPKLDTGQYLSNLKLMTKIIKH